jgi:transcriptional regulator with GAF, ATPase, and Fis domain
MSHGARLLDIARRLLSETEPAAAARAVLDELLAITGATRGFVVARHGDEFVDLFNIQFDRARVSTGERRFSRAVVRRAIETRDLVYAPSAADDARFGKVESVVEIIGRRAVLAVPLCHADEVLGVVYLDGPAPIDGAARLISVDVAALAGPLLRRAIAEEALRARARSLENDLLARLDFGGIVTRDPKMLALLRTVAQVADASSGPQRDREDRARPALCTAAEHSRVPRAAPSL